ncbi:MAG: DUF3800 domain-containing protein [Syntrophorhabdales bacterium]|jgi:hypothetical protein
MMPILTAYLDESADEKRKDFFCVGAILTSEYHWKEIEKRWAKRLSEDDIEYFSATNCKAVKGPFWKLRKKCGSFLLAKKTADKIRSDLEEILLSFPWIGFGIGIFMSDYKEVLNTSLIATTFYSEDPTIAAYSQAMYEIVRAVRREAQKYAVAYIIDDSTYSDKIINAFKALKKIHPTLAKSIATILPLDDKTVPSLQAADLIANITKDGFLEWLNKGTSRAYPLKVQWRSHFELIGIGDKDHIFRSLSRTIKSQRFTKGLLPEQRVSGRERKQRRKVLMKKLGVINSDS